MIALFLALSYLMPYCRGAWERWLAEHGTGRRPRTDVALDEPGTAVELVETCEVRLGGGLHLGGRERHLGALHVHVAVSRQANDHQLAVALEVGEREHDVLERVRRGLGIAVKVADGGKRGLHPATVAVLPEAEEVDIDIRAEDIRIDTMRASGAGGQHVNTTDSAVRMTHIPTGIVVSMQNEKSQLQNREAAMRVLRARLLAKQQEERDAAASDARRSQIRGMDRSERIRTYNFPENRIADHRTGFKAYNLDQVMNGALEPVIASCIEADEEAQLAAVGDQS